MKIAAQLGHLQSEAVYADVVGYYRKPYTGTHMMCVDTQHGRSEVPVGSMVVVMDPDDE